MRDADVVSVTPLLTDTEWIETTFLHTQREFSSKFNQLEMNTQTEVSIRMSKEAEN